MWNRVHNPPFHLYSNTCMYQLTAKEDKSLREVTVQAYENSSNNGATFSDNSETVYLSYVKAWDVTSNKNDGNIIFFYEHTYTTTTSSSSTKWRKNKLLNCSGNNEIDVIVRIWNDYSFPELALHERWSTMIRNAFMRHVHEDIAWMELLGIIAFWCCCFCI